MSKKRTILKGTLILTCTGLLCRFIGFFYNIFLSYHFGEEGVGLYHLIFPVYVLCLSISSFGIQTALSRIVAKYTALGQAKKVHLTLYSGLLISTFLSFILFLIVRENASYIGIHFLGDSRCIPLLSCMTYAFFFSSIHSCLTAYYYGHKETMVPALSQLIEQVVRVATVYLLFYTLTGKGETPTIGIAVTGLVFSEIISALFCIYLYSYTQVAPGTGLNFSNFLGCGLELVGTALPLTFNRVAITFMQSVETISIPGRLALYGCSDTEALRVYGVLTGMALPCILFPSAITNAVSTMLLPTVAELTATQKKKELQRLIHRVIIISMILGACCLLFFLVAGSFLGELLFASSLAGHFIKALCWICPFLYLNTTLTSMLNGLGKTWSTFIIQSLGLLLRIWGVFFLIPKLGIYGYLIGLFISQVFIAIVSILFIQKYEKA